jgi:hypothetical protein
MQHEGWLHVDVFSMLNLDFQCELLTPMTL